MRPRRKRTRLPRESPGDRLSHFRVWHAIKQGEVCSTMNAQLNDGVQRFVIAPRFWLSWNYPPVARIRPNLVRVNRVRTAQHGTDFTTWIDLIGEFERYLVARSTSLSGAIRARGFAVPGAIAMMLRVTSHRGTSRRYRGSANDNVAAK